MQFTFSGRNTCNDQILTYLDPVFSLNNSCSYLNAYLLQIFMELHKPQTQVICLLSSPLVFFSSLLSYLLAILCFSHCDFFFRWSRWVSMHKLILFCLYWHMKNCKLSTCLQVVEISIPGKEKLSLCFF